VAASTEALCNPVTSVLLLRDGVGMTFELLVIVVDIGVVLLAAHTTLQWPNKTAMTIKTPSWFTPDLAKLIRPPIPYFASYQWQVVPGITLTGDWQDN